MAMGGRANARLAGRFVLSTAVILLSLAGAGIVGLSRLSAQEQRGEIGLTFSHLGEGIARLDIAAHRALDRGLAADRALLRRSYLAVLYHLEELRQAEPERIAARAALAAVGEMPMGPPDIAPKPIDRVMQQRLQAFEPPHRHGLGAMEMPPALHALWKGAAGSLGLEGAITRILMRLEPFAFGTGPLDMRERAALAALERSDTEALVDMLRDGSILMIREHRRAADAALEALGMALAVGAGAALVNLVALLLPLARTVEADRMALAAARDAAQAADRAKGEFLATMSHELRTPLNGVIGMASVLEATGLDARQRGCIGVIRGSAEALGTVIADILEYSRLDAGKLRLELEPFAVERLGREPAARLAPAAVLKGLDLMVRVDPASPSMLVGDAERLDHIVTNLLSNAVKFTARGSILVDISARDLGDGRADLRIAVRDTGRGVAAEQAGRIFGLFTQGDQSATRAAGGVGLGLAVCRTLLDMMGGRIALMPHDGPGATFEAALTLPIASAAPCVGRDARLFGMRAVVVSPSPERRRFLVEVLSALGMQAEGTRDAVLLPHAAGRCDIALLDHAPPELDALAALAEFRETPAGADAGSRRLAFAVLAGTPLGMEDAVACTEIAKPASPLALREGLAAALAARDGAALAAEAAQDRGCPQDRKAGRAMPPRWLESA